ncbi:MULTISPECIES: AbrB/MazE/SpoVT family DNA-binding domain-containing protein [Thermoactinomyces]|jgi:AbrB family transcriptional regulator, transcriptional pleiotropic regulator of transition state genes|nr:MULTISPECIES: AbrB/MazE/SpoVT family DNA-binding domain-containing protein [Thermoactinomyces]KFZ40105.1 AbrB family transcriptional regulator [Thermoactinomyces sp. Gus2-1]KYQ86499.1 AbrB family transcriptional regulator [Thermoactinomyces sp. AS95]QBK13399.1 AbrB/MazE/SpoVT family DNA-binding domain-containing protein [Thermoactinomyces vulgaris]QCV54769.1 AbrB/MazE/SpoVT family DNA-binding domain-containing protein [Thermoactinomyces vulgaris]RMA98064.1 transcriptional pleiotropic regula
MKGTGIVRKVDHLGRIVLPKGLRDLLNIHPSDGVEVFVDDQYIVLKKYEPNCIFCGSLEEVIYYRGKMICKKCVEETSKVMMKGAPE